MSGKSIQRTLNNAFSVVGRVLGWEFTIYRPVSWVIPMSDANFIGTLLMSASPDEAYAKNPTDELDKFMLYCNTSLLEVGDILTSVELDKTYIVFDKTELRAVIGVLSGDKFDLLRPTHTPGADKPMGFEQIATQVPAAVKLVGSTADAGALKITSSIMTSAASELEVWTWMPTGFVAIGDVLEFNGYRYLITFVQNSSKGTKIKARSTKVGK